MIWQGRKVGFGQVCFGANGKGLVRQEWQGCIRSGMVRFGRHGWRVQAWLCSGMVRWGAVTNVRESFGGAVPVRFVVLSSGSDWLGRFGMAGFKIILV